MSKLQLEDHPVYPPTYPKRKQLSDLPNTRVYTFETGGYVLFYDTTIVQWNDTNISLDTGGYDTTITLARMNLASQEFDLGYRVYRKKGVWHCEYNDRIYKFNGRSVTMLRS